MEKSLITSAILLLLSFTLSAQSASVSSTYVKVSGDWETLEIHAKIHVSGMKEKEGKVIVYFYDKNGNALNDRDRSYYTSDGKVSTSKKITPRYDNSVYNDLTISIPTRQLHISGFGNKIYYKISVRDHTGDQLCLSGPHFALTAGALENDGTWSSYTLGTLSHVRTMCYGCNQTGKCPYCGGSGQVFSFMGYIPCNICAMTGICSICIGQGFVESKTVVGVSTVPAVPVTPPAGGVYNGGIYDNTIPSSGSTSTRRTCPGCNGTGQGLNRIEYAPNYTGQDNSIYCAECGRVMSAHTHIHEMCKVCYGKGYVD